MAEVVVKAKKDADNVLMVFKSEARAEVVLEAIAEVVVEAKEDADNGLMVLKSVALAAVVVKATAKVVVEATAEVVVKAMAEVEVAALAGVDVVAVEVVETKGRHAAPTVENPGPHDDEQEALPDGEKVPLSHGMQELLPYWANKEYVPAVQFWHVAFCTK